MKDFFKTILILFFAGLVFSCSGVLSDDDKATPNESGSYITLSVGSEARTIFPTVSLDDFSTLILKGTKEGESAKTLGSWKSVAEMQEATIAVSQGKWSFTLTAYLHSVTNSIGDGAKFEGTTEKEIVLGENALSFELLLSNKGWVVNGKGKGSFSLTLSYADSKNASCVSYVIANLECLESSSLKTGYEEVRLEPVNNTVNFVANDLYLFAYRIKITFYGEDGAILATYREILYIIHGTTTTATHTIDIDNNSNYSITYETNGGTWCAGSVVPITFTPKTGVLLANTVEREHYTFVGWYTDENCTEGNEITSTKGLQRDIKVYAKWTYTTYTVTFNTIGGSNVNSQSVIYGGTATEPSEPTKPSSKFGGWYISSDGGKTLSTTAFNFSTPISSDITLYAKWYVLYTVTFDSMGGTSVDSQTVWSGTNATLPTAPEKSLYELMGWYTSSDNGTTLSETAFDFATPIESDITLYAKWCVTKNTLAEKIKSLTESETIVVAGILTGDDLKNVDIWSALRTLYSTNENVFVTLDLSCVEGLTSIPARGKPSYSVSYSYSAPYPNLAGIILPSTVETIGDFAFCQCTSLTEITIPDSVTSIGASAFWECTNLTNIIVGENVESIGVSAFSSTGITSIILPTKLTTLTSCLSGCKELESVTIPDSVTTVGNYAFKGCTSLKSIVIPYNVKSLGSRDEGQAFLGCTSLESVTIEGLSYIGERTFSGCTSLKTVKFSRVAMRLGPYVFENCSALETIDLAAIWEMNVGAFSGCTSLTNVTPNDTWYYRTTEAAASNSSQKFTMNAENLKTYSQKFLSKNCY